MPVPDALRGVLQRSELVEVRGEEAEAARLLREVPRDRPCDAKPVGGRGTAAKLVHNNQRPLAGRVQDARGLQHLRHESRDPSQLHVRGTHAAHDRVKDRQRRLPARHEATNLVQQSDQGHRADVGTLTAHVGTGDEVQARLVPVHVEVIRDEGLVRVGHDQDVRSPLEAERLRRGVHGGADEVAGRGEHNTRERREHVEVAHDFVHPLNHRDVRGRHRKGLARQLRGLLVVPGNRVLVGLVQLVQLRGGEDELLLLDG
mmetsp:Transcript_30938/g.78887  ORF Transcript_30938/g.78887 Transcript_30938/m.78887 type:complete len:259 (-) Transcript_30938:1297-2073(-)